MDPNLTWDLILELITLRGTQLDHLECSRMAVGDVAGVTAWVYIVHCALSSEILNFFPKSKISMNQCEVGNNYEWNM